VEGKGDMTEEIEIRRAGRQDVAAIAELVRRATRSRTAVDEGQVKEWLFSKGLWVAAQNDALVGVAAWQAENLVSVTDVFHVAPARLRKTAGAKLLKAVEQEANVLMCEANVLLLPPRTPQAVRSFLQDLGYEPQELQALHRIWREVLADFVGEESDLMVKRLRDRMVMVPI
jgi:N-acetylglutamate synthase-like GNAT family acetyltransferase